MTATLPKIGILDSGVGGLSVLREIRKLIPGADLHYVGDSAWCPYGTKTPEEIRDRVFHISDYLIEQGAEIIVIACNSATIHGVGALRATYPLPIVGMEPAVKPAAELTRSGVVGVLATEASIAGEKFHQLVSTHASRIKVITRPCPRFVELVEEGIVEGTEVDRSVREAICPLLEEGADVLVLGCTHYPFLRAAIQNVAGSSVQVVDTGPAVAKRVASVAGFFLERDAPGAITIETSGPIERLERLFPILLPETEVVLSQAAI